MEDVNRHIFDPKFPASAKQWNCGVKTEMIPEDANKLSSVLPSKTKSVSFQDLASFNKEDSIRKYSDDCLDGVGHKRTSPAPMDAETSSKKLRSNCGSAVDTMTDFINANSDLSIDSSKETLLNTSLPTFVRRHNSTTMKVNRMSKEITALKEKLHTQADRNRTNYHPLLPDLVNIQTMANRGNPRAILMLDQIKGFFKGSKCEWSDTSLRYCAQWKRKSADGYRFARNFRLLKLPDVEQVDLYMLRSKSPHLLQESVEAENIDQLQSIFGQLHVEDESAGSSSSGSLSLPGSTSKLSLIPNGEVSST